VLLHLLSAHGWQIVTPTGENTRHQPFFGQILNPKVGHVEVGRVDSFIIRFPGEPGFIGAYWMQIWQQERGQTGHDLNDTEPLLT